MQAEKSGPSLLSRRSRSSSSPSRRGILLKFVDRLRRVAGDRRHRDRRGDRRHLGAARPALSAPVGGAYLVIAFFFGLAGGVVGKIKGSSFCAVVPDLGDRAVPRPARGGPLPLRAATSCAASARDCGKIVKLYDALCTRCGTELEFPEVGRSSRRAARARRPLALARFGHPRAGRRSTQMRAVDAVMECLKAEGVDVVFGYPGGANLPTYDAFVRRGHPPRPRAPRGGRRPRRRGLREGDRQGRRRASRTAGPGATNLVTPITDAMMDSVPVVFITGQVRTELLGTDGFQEADMIGITMPIVKHSFMIQHPLEIPRVIHEAFHIARTGRPGPGAWSTSRRTSRGRTSTTSRSTDVHLPGYQPTTEGNTKQIRQAAKALARRAPARHLRGRRRHQRRRLGRADRARAAATASRSPAR